MPVDRDLSNLNAELAEKVKVIPGLDVRLALIDTEAGEDKYHVMQGLRDTTTGDDAQCCYVYQRCGGTGTRGHLTLDGPMEQPKAAKALAGVFEEKTGHEWGSVEPGHRALPGKYWLQQHATPDLEAKWQYYVSDGVDGKATGWYDYEPSASAEVEELYAQHVSNAREARTATRLVHSSYFTYKVDLGSMTQQNTRTHKMRTIRRAAGEEEAQVGAGAGRVNVPTARLAKVRAMKTARAMKESRGIQAAAAMKAMKVMKVKKPSKIGSKKQVLSGKREKTKGGLRAPDLMKSKSSNKIVGRRKSAAGTRQFAKNIAPWLSAVSKAREELGLSGFVLIKKGSALYSRAKELHSVS